MNKNSKTSNKLILKSEDVIERILSGLDKISLPVIQTISPQGKNVLIQMDNGEFKLTNDGVTIAGSIDVEDQVESAIINNIKESARATNMVAGDGTSTTILFARTLVKRSLELSKKGYTQKQIRDMIESISTKILNRLETLKKEVTDDKTLKEVASISANNDTEVAKFVVDTINTAGLDGLVVLDLSGDETTRVEKQPGFRIPAGMIYENLYPDKSRPQIAYKDIPVVIFDKSLYYTEESEHIIRVAKDLGYEQLVIIAKDFVGESPNTLISNHVHGIIKLVLIKISDSTTMEDVAVYIGGNIVSESGGRRVDSINLKDFTKVSSILCDPEKVLINSGKENRVLNARVRELKKDLEKDKNNEKLKSRIASLTNGLVTIKVGGRTAREARERAYRYEDAINAVRASQRWGYLVGGGVSIYNSFKTSDYSTRDERDTARLLATASVTQIADNSQLDLDFEKITSTTGLNSLTGKYEDLLKAGVVEPFKVTEMAIKNAVAVANTITSIGTYVVVDYSDIKDEK